MWLRCDNGQEYISHQVLHDWTKANNMQLIFFQKGKPHQNGYMERFNRKYREEILDNYAFYSLAQAMLLTQAGMWVYNIERPHISLNYMTLGSC